MVNLPPDSNESRRSDLVISFDEFIALIVAFLSVGAILLWGLTRGSGSGFRRLLDANLLSEQGLSEPIVEVENSGELEADLEVEVAPAPLLGLGRDETSSLSRLETEPSYDSNGQEFFSSGSWISAMPQIAPVPEAVSPEISPTAGETPEASTPDVPIDPALATPPPLDISDVSEDYWAYPFIQRLYDQGLLPDLPEGKFQPDKSLTRAELAALISQAFLQGEAEQAPGFIDVPANYWAAGAIQRTVETGFMSGYPEGDFRPDELVPRYEVLVSLASGLGLKPANDPSQTLLQFLDADALPMWAFSKVAAATETGVAVNYPDRTRLEPQEPATHAEIAVMIYQALLETGQVEKIDSPYVIPKSQFE